MFDWSPACAGWTLFEFVGGQGYLTRFFGALWPSQNDSSLEQKKKPSRNRLGFSFLKD